VTTLDETRLVGFIEAVFSLEIDDRGWLAQLLSAFEALCGSEHHYRGFFYDASDVNHLKLWNVAAPQSTPELDATFEPLARSVDPEFVTSTFRSLPVSSARKSGMPQLAPVLAQLEQNGWGDFFHLNGLDASGIGCLLLCVCREREFSPSPAELRLFRRLAANLSTAFRCRRKLSSIPTLEASASEKPSEDVNARLAQVVSAAEEQLRAVAAAEPDDAPPIKSKRARRNSLDFMHPSSTAHLTLVHTFEENGSRYIVARESEAHAGIGALTERERQIVRHASDGFTNKQIAYDLGISDATVRVLMARAANRIGVRTRRELLAHPALRELRSQAAPENAAPPSARAG
jgi:DNA-binding CsgD family transcriptional regulator